MSRRKTPVFPAIMAVLFLGIMAACVIWLLSLPSNVRPEQSAFGFNGLRAWLVANDVEARRFIGGGQLDADQVGLRILPLMDDRTDRFDGMFGGDTEPFLRGEIRSIRDTVISQKIEDIPTLIVLAKWRDGIRLGGTIHPDFLLPTDPLPGESGTLLDMGVEDDEASEADGDPGYDGDWDIEGFAGEGDTIKIDDGIDVSDIRRLASGAPYQIEQVGLSDFISGTATLYAPQYASAPEQCRPVIGEQNRGLLFSCTTAGHPFWVLSDPDLLNNHGLPRSENAAIALELIRSLAGEGSVVIDYSTIVWVMPEHDSQGRSWTDLLGYFQPPFAWLWLAGLGFLIVLLWRGGIRGVPLIRGFTEGHGAARQTALAAQARLMRRARADGALLKALAVSYVNTLAERILGRDGRVKQRRAHVIRVLRHRDRSTAEALAAAFLEIETLPNDASSDQTIPALSRLHSAYEKALKLT